MADRDEELLAQINACIRKEEGAWRVFMEEYGKTIAKFTKRTVREEREDYHSNSIRKALDRWTSEFQRDDQERV
jgi:hypothetical protein